MNCADLQTAIHEFVAARKMPEALDALRNGWDVFLRDRGTAGARALLAEFGAGDLLPCVETASIVWLLNAVPPESEPVGPFATRILAATEDEIRGLPVRGRMTVMTAKMLVLLGRGRTDDARTVSRESLDSVGGLGRVVITTIGPVYAEFGLALARVKLFSGALRESVELFNEVLAFTDVVGMPVTTYRALVGQAIAFALNAEFDVSQNLIASAKDIGPDADYDWSAQAIELAWCQTLIWSYQGRDAELDTAAKRVGARAAVDPDWNALAQVIRARVLIRDGHDLEAANLMKKLLQSVAVSTGFPFLETSARFLLGLALIKADQPNAALRAIDKAPATTLHTSGITAIRAFALIGRGQPAEAIEATDVCIALGLEHPALPLVYVQGARAVAFELLGLPASADYCLSTGLSIAESASINMEHDAFAGPQLEYLWERVSSKRGAASQHGAIHGAVSDIGERLARLTPKEQEVLRRLARPGTLADVGADLFISQNTVKAHTRSIYRKLAISSRAEASDLVNTAGH